jgi:hypothetical protein
VGPVGPVGPKGDTGAQASLPAGTIVFVLAGDPAPEGYTLIASFKQAMDFTPNDNRGRQRQVEVLVYRKN